MRSRTKSIDAIRLAPILPARSVRRCLARTIVARDFELLWRQRRLVDEIHQRVQVLHARHRNVQTPLVVEIRERHVIEAVDVHDQVELLSDRQEIREREGFLRLLVALVTETERDHLFVLEERMLPQHLQQAMRTHLTEPEADRAAERPDDKLAAALLHEGIAVRRDESKIVRVQTGGCRAAHPQRLGNVEQGTGRMCRTEVRMQRLGDQPPVLRCRKQILIGPATGVKQAARLDVICRQRRQFGAQEENDHAGR